MLNALCATCTKLPIWVSQGLWVFHWPQYLWIMYFILIVINNYIYTNYDYVTEFMNKGMMDNKLWG